MTNICFGQNFFESETTEEPTANNQGSMFAEHTQPPDPDQGTDGPGNPESPIPINGGWYLLVFGGIGIGVYFLNAVRKRKTA